MLKARTAMACRVTEVHPDRLNEWIAAGVYTCAPYTTPGKSRVFTMRDMVSLWLFRQLMNRGFSAPHSASLACSATEGLPYDGPFPEWAGLYGPHSCRGTAAQVAEQMDRGHFDFALMFRIASVVQLIEDRLSEEAKIIGGDD